MANQNDHANESTRFNMNPLPLYHQQIDKIITFYVIFTKLHVTHDFCDGRAGSQGYIVVLRQAKFDLVNYPKSL
jgi:hypothetical protein